ncbi:hypothetical protein HAU32_10285 [Weissella confusa]|uniref:HD domain-containing protein n=1 Tax=Weissella fermenti TaxID=2987699 RepID=A0ABT6D4P7_9LACO|nr:MULTISPECIES: hypothetical protein [Weissella]MBJ7689331.1 hypothetical protein [Weissella confusa]MCW0925961.1 hypothetical protein [Weissella sp. LMG 11983]MDF9300490.1 hypothetical protein [Weissella sp. BK2]
MKQLILTAGLSNGDMAAFVAQLQRNNSNIRVFDAFQERLNQYGTLDITHTQDVTVYNRIYNLLDTAILQNEEGVFVLLDSNLTRSRRRGMYNRYKEPKYGVSQVTTHFFIRSYSELMNDENGLSSKSVKAQYISFQPPRIGVDADEVIIHSDIFNTVDRDKIITSHSADELFTQLLVTPLADEIKLDYQSHDNPHHLESIKEHIDMTIKAAPADELRQVAMFHDLGKGITKSVDGITGIAHMPGHQSVGAMIAFAFYGEPNNITETVLWHMEAHKDISTKVVKRERLDLPVMELLQKFAVIDSKARIDVTL